MVPPLHCTSTFFYTQYVVLPNLNKTKIQVKKLIAKGSIVLIALILVFILIRTLTSVKDSFFPDRSLLPQVYFGKLPALFPDNSEKADLSYTLDTITGTLPSFQKIVKVYKIIPGKPGLLAVQKTQDKVAGVGFKKEGTPISKDSYQWIEQNPPQTITINIFSSDFTFLTPYLATENIQTFSNSDELKMTIKEAQTFLARMTLFPQDIDSEKTKTANYSIKNNALSPASSISSTNIVRVDFFQKDVENLPIFYKDGLTSGINLLVGKENNNLKIVEAHYAYRNISEESSTYSIKTANEAFIELKQGKAYIAVRPQDNNNNIPIKKVSLGYYMGENIDFLMPIIVFQGDNFLGYVSGVTDEWINN